MVNKIKIRTMQGENRKNDRPESYQDKKTVADYG